MTGFGGVMLGFTKIKLHFGNGLTFTKLKAKGEMLKNSFCKFFVFKFCVFVTDFSKREQVDEKLILRDSQKAKIGLTH